jgi:cellulose synthase/poly-beta-1,6-N-acetylglucosamine synthase-like glycosyltransferase
MKELFGLFQLFMDWVFFLFGIGLVLSYVLLAIVSGRVLSKYMRKNSFIDYNAIISSPFAPSISIIAPAFNESKSIIDNIKSMLALFYHDYEVIIVNDGSTDDTMEKVISVFDLELVNFALEYKLKSKEIRGVYKSKNKAYANLILVDKENGGKSDALNAGINVSQKKYFVSIDVDAVILPDGLLKLAKPFLEESDRRLIATGGVIRIANSCLVEGGSLIKIRFPKNLLARFQVVEYNRAFLMGRMAWSELDGLLLISGALGLFDKEIVILSGGYAETVGEDMELVVRMRRYMVENELPYDVDYIPDPLCYTEVPTSLKIFLRQRNRWTRGTIDTLFMHSKLFFNPKYGRMGTMGYPYWFFFEWLAPLVEFVGIAYFVILQLVGAPDWGFFLLMFVVIYSFAMLFSSYAILYEELTFHAYEKRKDIILMFFTALLEPVIYHPLVLFAALWGNFDYFINHKRVWGKMERKGFGPTSS